MTDFPNISIPRTRRILFGAMYSSIEPLGLLYLAGLARDLGWEPHIRLVKNHDFSVMEEAIRDIRPEIVGYTLFTGNHEPLYAFFSRVKRLWPHIRTVIGGPQATYFPLKSAEHADNIVVSEGFDALSRLLTDRAGLGILYPTRLMSFPQPERERFYRDYSEHARNPIKNIISMTGCPYACTYCYNSSFIEDTLGAQLKPSEINALNRVLGPSRRLFPRNLRTTESVLQEIRTVMQIAPATRMFYWQDDTLGISRHLDFLKRFREIHTDSILFHGQTRFEMIDPETGRGRLVLSLLRELGFTGMTMAIEAADETIRREVLNRVMPPALIFRGVKALADHGFRLRTEQITGLPYGATSAPTKINLDADLELLALNMNLRRTSGGLPNVSWTTTLIPYLGTRMSDYCVEFGFVNEDTAKNPEEGYHERSVLRHLRQHIGPSLRERKHDPDVWLEPADQDQYRDQNTQLRLNFHILSYLSNLPDAEAFVERYLRRHTHYSLAILNDDMRRYIKSHPSPAAEPFRKKLRRFEAHIDSLTESPRDRERLHAISAYAAVLPGDGNDLARRFLRYSNNKDDTFLFCNIVKKYLFDTQLYLMRECTCELYDDHVLSGGAALSLPDHPDTVG